jgi:ornithine cyclodeaminase/alanine dehydrogenase-like protein (mu-crystallin family)
MTLVLSNDDVRELLPVPVYIESMESAYRHWGRQNALVQPRIDMYSPSPERRSSYVFKTMTGLIPDDDLVALRINSDIITWQERNGSLRKEKVPSAQGDRWVGLVFLFDMVSGELIAILPDGIMQQSRVAATTAVAAKYLARPDSARLAVVGSGGQAEAAILAMSAAMPSITSIDVWSPTEHKRNGLVKRCVDSGLNARVATSAEEAVVGADLVVTATNSLEPVIESSWVSPGAFVACVKSVELGRELLTDADRVILHARPLDPVNYIVGQGDAAIHGTDPVDKLFGEPLSRTGVDDIVADLAETCPVLADVLLDDSLGRRSPDDRIVFLNPMGTGLQFAAVGRALYLAAKETGRGHELPGDWFSEDIQC